MASSPSHSDSSKQRIITAAFAGDLQLLKKLAKEYANGGEIAKALKEVWDTFGRNALHAAAAGITGTEGKLDVCKYLIEELKFDVNEQDANGDTPLHISTLEEDYVTSSYLLDHGADCNMAADKGFTPLHYAAKRGRTNLLQLLISNGAQVDAQSYVGTPLQAAAVHGMSDAVEFCSKIRLMYSNPNLASPNTLPSLLAAIQAKSVLCARSLLEWGANPNDAARGTTPLIEAVSEGQTDIIMRLLALGADPDVPNFYELTPLKIAAKLGHHADVMALLPVTTPIPGISDWSVRGIIEHVNSPKARYEREHMIERKFLEAKAKGTEAVKKGHYLEAACWYTEALGLKPTDAAVLSNRSLCWARLEEGKRALVDALACIELRDDWPKAHYRAGVAWALLRDYEQAKKEYEHALKLDPENKELQESYREAVLDLLTVEKYKKEHDMPSMFDIDPHEEYYQEYISSLL